MSMRGFIQVCLKEICFHFRRRERAFRRFECGRRAFSCALIGGVSKSVYIGWKERSRRTAAAAELGDMGRWRVDIAGALVSPLISAPRLELVLRGLPIVIHMVLSVASFQSSLGLCFSYFAKFGMCLLKFIRRGLAWKSGGDNSAPFR